MTTSMAAESPKTPKTKGKIASFFQALSGQKQRSEQPKMRAVKSSTTSRGPRYLPARFLARMLTPRTPRQAFRSDSEGRNSDTSEKPYSVKEATSLTGAAVERSPQAMFLVDPWTADITHASQSASVFLGLGKSGLKGRCLLEFALGVSPTDWGELVSQLAGTAPRRITLRLKVHGGVDIVTFDLHPFGTGLDLELLAAHSSPPAATTAATASAPTPPLTLFPQPLTRGQRSLTSPSGRAAARATPESDTSAGWPSVSPPPAAASRSATSSAAALASGVGSEPRSSMSFREEIALMDNSNGNGGSSSGRRSGKGKSPVAVEQGWTSTTAQISEEDAPVVSPSPQVQADVVQAAMWPVAPSATSRNKSPRGGRAAAAAAAARAGSAAGGESKPLPTYMTQSVPLTPAMLAAVRAAEDETDSEYDMVPPKIHRTDSTGAAQEAAARAVTKPVADKGVGVGVSRSASNRTRAPPAPAPRPQGHVAQSVPFTPAMLAGLRAADDEEEGSESDAPPPRVHRTDSTGAAQAAVLAGAHRMGSGRIVSSTQQTGSGSARLPTHMTQSVPLTPAMLAAIRAAEEGSEDESDVPPKIHRTDSTAAKQAVMAARQQEAVLAGGSSGQVGLSAIRAATAAAAAAARERASAQPRRSYTTQSVPFTPDMVAATIAAARVGGGGGIGEEDEEEGEDFFDTWDAQAVPTQPMSLAEELAATTPPRLSSSSDRQGVVSPGAGGAGVGKSPFPPTGKKNKKGRSFSGGKSAAGRRPAAPQPGSPALPAYYSGPSKTNAAAATSARSMPMTPDMVAMILAMDGDDDEDEEQEEGYGLQQQSSRAPPSQSRKGQRHAPRGVTPPPLKPSQNVKGGSYSAAPAVKAQGRLSTGSRHSGQGGREGRVRGGGGGGGGLDPSPPSSFRTHSLPFTSQMVAATLAANADEDEDGDGSGYYFDNSTRLPPSFTGWAGDIAPVIPSSSGGDPHPRRSKQSASPIASSPTAALRAVSASSQAEALIPAWAVRSPVVTSPFKQVLLPNSSGCHGLQASFKGGDIVRGHSGSLSQESVGSQEDGRRLSGVRGEVNNSGRRVGWADVREEEEEGGSTEARKLEC